MAQRNHHDLGFLAIAILKLVKGLLLFLVGVGALSLIHRDAAVVFKHWAHVFLLDIQSKFVQRSLVQIGLVKQRDLPLIVTTTFIYSALLLTEGVGLLMEKVWAEYMTTFITATFIPIEVYELVRHMTVIRASVLVTNVIVVAYLVMRLCQRKQAST